MRFFVPWQSTGKNIIWINKPLAKKLKDKLNDAEKAISTHNLYLKTFEENQQDKEVKDNA
jgi:hypothetical protein